MFVGFMIMDVSYMFVGFMIMALPTSLLVS